MPRMDAVLALEKKTETRYENATDETPKSQNVRKMRPLSLYLKIVVDVIAVMRIAMTRNTICAGAALCAAVAACAWWWRRAARPARRARTT